ncbi:MAG TPA: radical SAM protein [Myxococcota bacterium]|nr:radical SAM protein [Myxococcota bacterium]HQK52217.1 radical SAM protein [Myxococcota bacterium]
MKVLLLNPVLRDGTPSLRIGRCQGRVLVGLWPNVEHGILATALTREGFDVRLLDANHDRLSFGEMIARVVREAPDLVFLLSITASLEDDREAARLIQAARPATWVALWGTHATVRPEDYLGPDRTVAIRREPEVTGLHWAMAVRSGATTFDDVPGVSWTDQGQVHHAPDRPFAPDLDALPLPDHEAMGTGTHRAADTRRPFALVKTSRGCPFQCVFCTTHAFHGAVWRPRSPEAIVDEVVFLRRSRGIRDFFLQSDVFSRDRNWTLALMEALQRQAPGITWFSNSRVDTVDREVLQAMKASGCRLLAFGVESGSDAVLRASRKGTTAARAHQTLAWCREARIPSLTYWVFGLPGETPGTMEETLRFIDEVHPDYAHFYTPTPLPGSRLFEEWRIAEAVRSGEVRWSDFFQGVSSRFLAPGVTREQVNRVVHRAYLSFYTNPRRVLREMLRLRDPAMLEGRVRTVIDMVRNYAVKR